MEPINTLYLLRKTVGTSSGKKETDKLPLRFWMLQLKYPSNCDVACRLYFQAYRLMFSLNRCPHDIFSLLFMGFPFFIWVKRQYFRGQTTCLCELCVLCADILGCRCVSQMQCKLTAIWLVMNPTEVKT